MSDPIFLPLSVEQRKLQWTGVQLQNPVRGIPGIIAEAYVIDLQGGEPVRVDRAPQYDLSLAFDPADPDHVLLDEVFTRVLKAAHRKAHPEPIVP